MGKLATHAFVSKLHVAVDTRSHQHSDCNGRKALCRLLSCDGWSQAALTRAEITHRQAAAFGLSPYWKKG